MEGWEIRRRAARFRGIDLVVLSSTRSGGRRLDVHEFYGRELPYAEDVGRSARAFTVRGLVIGPDHDLQAERLEAAFEQSGPGELVLPHRAPIQVAVRGYNFEEPETEARLQRFEVDFVEAGLASAPGARPNTAGIVQERATGAFAAISERFEKVFSISDQTKAQIDRIVGVATDGADLVTAAFDVLKAGSAALEEINAYQRDIIEFTRNVSGSIVDAAVVAAEFQRRFDDLLDLPFLPLEVYRYLADVVEFGADLPDPGTNTVARRSFKRNQDGLVGMISRSATATRAKALSRATFESSSEASGYRDEIAAELGRAILQASDAFADAEAAALRALRTATIRDLDARAAKLPARVVFALPAQLPAIVVAQRLYGDVAREADIVTRNRKLVRHPGRIPYGTPLEVLADA